MSLPIPESGLVISYAYLWQYQQQKGLLEGTKNRPCVIVLAVENQSDGTQVTVAPITHTPPHPQTACIEIPLRVKQYLGLDEERSWVVLEEVNQFIWPGYDLRPIAGQNTKKYDYGFLPPALFDKIRNGILQVILKKRDAIVERD